MSTAEEMEKLTRQLIQGGKLREAAELCDKMNQQYPEFSGGWYTSSHLAMLLKEPRLAVGAIDRALELSPENPEWLFHRVECLMAMNEIDAARFTVEQLGDKLFDSAEVSAGFAHSLSRMGLLEEARRHYINAIDLDPDESRYYYNLATVERMLGNIRAAHKAVSRCIELQPDDDEAHLLRAGLVTQTPKFNNVNTLLDAFARADGQARRQVKLSFALAKELEDIGDYPRSFEFLSKGASLRRSNMNYDPEKDLDAIQNIQKVYSSDMFDGHIEGHINAEPVFVIGMPRSGITLVERILSSHSVVHPAGDQQNFSLELVKHCQQISGSESNSPSELVALSTSIDFVALGEDYIASTQPDAGASAHFVDKLPLNFLYAGLIHLALPKARIVLLERDPMDTCYAVYKTLFEGVYPFSYDLQEMANYYVAYRRLIDHWQSVMPGVMHVVKYEDLATKPKSVIEDLLSHCGLSWEDACLKFYENTNPSLNSKLTAAQANIFKSSIGSWRNYEEQLKPVSDILGELY